MEPEILDSLAPDDPAAVANRRDIRILNQLMGNFNWFARRLAEQDGFDGILELAAGDGSLGRYLRDHGIVDREEPCLGLDLIPRPGQWPIRWSWQQRDIRRFPFDTAHGTLVANLILHQFEREDLRFIGQRIDHSQVRRILVNEPARRRLSLWMIPLFKLLRMHKVSLYDARVSIRAGFRKGEIHEQLGLDPRSWNIRYTKGPGAVRMEAVRA